MMYLKYLLAFAITVVVMAGVCSSGATPSVSIGEDWSVPSWVTQYPNSGFFSESATTKLNINVSVFDIAWRQVNPSQGVYATNIPGQVKDLVLDSFAEQNSTTKPFWMRIWASGALWAPTWIQSYCNVGVIGVDYDGEGHLPIWNPCVWGQLKQLYRYLFITNNMRADPRLKFIYVPGAFNWCEFDFDIIGNFSTKTGYTYTEFNTWFQQAMQDLVNIFNGENTDPSDDYAYKLVYTGEDFPFDVDQWPQAKNFLARDAVQKGMGIRTGITELSNFHLSQIPAYGYTIDPNGYLVLNKSWPLQQNPKRVIATENECYNACGFKVSAANLFYAVKMSNLKAIQMGVNWLYVVATDSYIAKYAAHWNWVRLEIGKSASQAYDAWAQLRSAQDTFWSGNSYPLTWKGMPYVNNYERYLTQRDVAPGAVTVKGTTKYSKILDPTNGIAYEGRATNLTSGNNAIVFYLDDEFVSPANQAATPVTIKVTYLDNQDTTWALQYINVAGVLTVTDPVVQAGLTKNLTTASFSITDAVFKNTVQPGNSDFKLLVTGTKNIEIWFIRVIKQTPFLINK
ncbi:hypothetical protein SAMD00019534_103880, partial [Acytostelium subglobosum LB1]|uniref:hypothetical protein n=1 Tax=Acytostelium subglobosum LB1 TaxID=1410327 RepID=UPI0006447BF9